jgi:SNF2 family DNA or RNA helicase
VTSLDLSWNYAAESQAYDRVHRLGQEKDVFVKRLVVKDTIEERWGSFSNIWGVRYD